jgi:unsaturated chondroitin disaccharide hydrolase
VTEAGGWLETAILNAVRRARAINREATDFPHITDGGHWRFTSDGVWTGGFWAGLLWLSSDVVDDGYLRQRAIEFTERLLPRASDRQNHDLGFMFVPSAVKAWRVLHDERYRKAALLAARTLADQFNDEGGYIPGWGFFGGDDWSGNVLIDTLMNLPLLVWAVKEGEDARLLDVVHRHAEMSIRYLMRDDGSVFHMYRFAPSTGEPLRGDTYQGYGPETTWSRGQAWAIAGFAMLGQMLSDDRYVAAAERAATYFLDQLSEDAVPLWDFQAPEHLRHRDASAGAIASYGLLRLADASGKTGYRDSAALLLSSLSRNCANRGNSGGLLLHATADLPHGHGIDESVIYGDYYYLKALLALRDRVGRGNGSGRDRGGPIA